MAIKLSAKRLSTLEGQAGIVSAIDLEKTLGHDDIKFEGDPSLRDLMVNRIGEFPYSDNLFLLQVLTKQHAWCDQQEREKWLAKNLPRVNDPRAIAEYFNEEKPYDDEEMLKLHPPVLDKVIYHLSMRSLGNLCQGMFQPKERMTEHMRDHLNLRALSRFIHHEASDNPDSTKHAARALQCMAKVDRRHTFPAIVDMVNRKLEDEYSKDTKNSLSSLVSDCYQFIRVKREGKELRLSLYDPHAFNYAEWLAELKEKRGRDYDDD